MNHAPQLALRVVKAARAGPASLEPEALEGLGVERLPSGRGCSGPVEAPDQLGALAGIGHLRG
eukprot:10428346-Alexandrium_andersonii.AAC.1